MKKTRVILRGNKEQDDEIKALLKSASEKVQLEYTVCATVNQSEAPYIFYKGVRFSGMIGIKEFLREVVFE